LDELLGTIERITFSNPDNGFTVARLKVKGIQDLVCTVGTMHGVQPGEAVRITGEWQVNPVHGRQFRVAECVISAPADLIGIRKYLESGLIHGIGKVYAEKIVEKFGLATLEIIDQQPERLIEVSGIGRKRARQIQECWSEQRAIRDVMIFLRRYGVSPAYAHRIFKVYGAETIPKLRENPFRLATEIRGIGFKSADKVAAEMGISHTSPHRVEAGIEYCLSEASAEGHVCYPLTQFVEIAAGMLQVDCPHVQASIEKLLTAKRIAVQPLQPGGEEHIWLRLLFITEEGIAREVHRLCSHSSRLRPVDLERALAWVQERLHLKLAPQQAEAVGAALSQKVVIITGGPGTGKSTITKAILAVTEKITRQIILAAPTGRAAKRMTEITKRQAQTIHSLLEFDFQTGGFKRGRDQPLACDLIVVDEASMIDTSLMFSLLKAIPDTARLVLVGDINQLPSVGPGNVLKDIIGSNRVPVSTLTQIYRQGRGSKIVINAHRINEGHFPDLSGGGDSDFFFVEAEEAESVSRAIVDLVAERLPKRYRFHPIDEIQVLAPMKRGVAGTEQLNILLQERLNPDQPPLNYHGRSFRQGDKVMQIRNNYDKEVFNGDVGRIVRIDQQVTVNFDGKEVVYDFFNLDELLLAYAVSIHKYQGSEAPCVVIPVHTTHFKLLNRNLLYTGVTRGKRIVVLVGTKKAIAIAVQNDEVKQRYTGLKEALLRP
jgi:exodeoxyribonuclease V alpha subunit